jgi:hypothetical protein
MNNFLMEPRVEDPESLKTLGAIKNVAGKVTVEPRTGKTCLNDRRHDVIPLLLGNCSCGHGAFQRFQNGRVERVPDIVFFKESCSKVIGE